MYEENNKPEPTELIEAPEPTEMLMPTTEPEMQPTITESVDTETMPSFESPQSFDMVQPVVAPVQAAEPVVDAVQKPVEVVVDDKQKVVKKSKKNVLKTILIILLVLIMIAGAAVGAYFWRDKTAVDYEIQQASDITLLKKDKADLESELALEKAKTEAALSIAPASSVIENIKDSITSGNTAALEGYMATNVIVANAGGNSVEGTASQAVASVTAFITGITSLWDFALPTVTLEAYTNGTYGQYFAETSVVGKNTNKKVISFSFDSNSKISKVFLATNESLVTTDTAN